MTDLTDPEREGRKEGGGGNARVFLNYAGQPPINPARLGKKGRGKCIDCRPIHLVPQSEAKGRDTEEGANADDGRLHPKTGKTPSGAGRKIDLVKSESPSHPHPVTVIEGDVTAGGCMRAQKSLNTLTDKKMTTRTHPHEEEEHEKKEEGFSVKRNPAHTNNRIIATRGI